MRLVGAALAIVTFSAGLAAAILFYRQDVAARKPVTDHVQKFQLELRRPDVATTVDYAPAADWGADIVADSSIRDVYEPADLSHATAEERAAWIRSITYLSDELHSSRDLLLDAIDRRPGWPFHESLLGQVVLAAETRDRTPELFSHSERWSRPLLIAAQSAPGATSVWQALAVGYIQTWAQLGDSHRPTSSLVLRNAFADPDFVRVVFPSVAAVVGPEIATHDLPESAKPLLVASDYFAKQNDIDWAWTLRQRWERAEWAARARDLEEIQRYASRGDVQETRRHCERWLALHSVWDFDSPAAHAQALRVLTLWPGGSVGSWRTDRFADVVRYLLSRNQDVNSDAPVLLRTAELFSDVPPATLAQIRLTAGDVAGAERLARSADDAGTLEWSSYLLMLARRQIVAKQLNEANLTLNRLPAAAQQTREALKARADIAVARGNSRSPSESDSTPLTGCGRDVRMSLGRRDWPSVEVRFRNATPAIVDIGINDARSASVRTDRVSAVGFRLVGSGERTFWMEAIAGEGKPCAEITEWSSPR